MNKLKIILSLLLIFIPVLLLTWCQKEEVTNTKSNTTLTQNQTESMDYIYSHPIVQKYRDIRDLPPAYNMSQAILDNSFGIWMELTNENVLEEFMKEYSEWKTSFIRAVHNSVEWDLVIYDIFYDNEKNKVTLITDFTRDKFSSKEDRVITLTEFDHIAKYVYDYIEYRVLYDWEINDDKFRSWNVRVLAILDV